MEKLNSNLRYQDISTFTQKLKELDTNEIQELKRFYQQLKRESFASTKNILLDKLFDTEKKVMELNSNICIIYQELLEIRRCFMGIFDLLIPILQERNSKLKEKVEASKLYSDEHLQESYNIKPKEQPEEEL